MKKSLKSKICIIGSALIALFVLLNIVSTYFLMNSFLMHMTAKQMKKMTSEILLNYEELDEDFLTYIQQIDEDYNTKITVINEGKEILVTTKSNSKSSTKSDTKDKKGQTLGQNTLLFFDENKQKLDDGKFAVRYRKKDEKVKDESIAVMKKIDDGRYIILWRSFRSLQNMTNAAIIFDLLAGSVIVIIGLLVVIRLSDFLVRPINQMKEAAEHISNLQFDIKVIQNSQDELGQLGMSINKMSEQLENNVIQLQNDIDNRKRLVRNLSHEIKSPVAVIMGYADRMKAIVEKKPEKVLNYCEIISNESSRIDILVKEMLEFSRLEQKMEMIQAETFYLYVLFGNIKQRIKEENLERNIELQFLYQKEDKLIADYILVERAAYNLVNNGISHSKEEKVKITVTGKQEENLYKITVHNTGSHIPEDELLSIWEAFYKIDKARVRNKNGCGIGLSIVREIVEAHQGVYTAGNDEQGVYFSISFPN